MMATVDQVAENRFMTLDRLLRGDRIVFQHKRGTMFPNAAWWHDHPQLGRPRLWLSTVNWMKAQGLIIDGLRPKDSTYREDGGISLYVATPKAEGAFLSLPAK